MPADDMGAVAAGTVKAQPSRAVRVTAQQALSRAAGAPLVSGNEVRLLRDGAENYPAWLEAIRSARRTIYFENYIVADDEVGREFVAALAERARRGVRVFALYDWLGAWGQATQELWRPLAEAGGAVRRFNPPRLDSPFGWLTRDHRKMISIDGEVAFVAGLCVSRNWIGNPARRKEAWRDTGIELRGPAVIDIEHAFGEAWSAAGVALPPDSYTDPASVRRQGEITLRVLATVPNLATLYRLDQLIAALARRTLWLTDAYFVGIAAYVQALRAAALDGVDVRLLVPGASDIPLLPPFSRAGYRPLLEAGVRVFEWNGPMLHAKTAVADGRWARVGSTNLNIASWLGNYELDVAIEDDGFARAMQDMYEHDLTHATELVLAPHNRVRATLPLRRGMRRGGSASRAAAGALRLGNTVGAAIIDRRVLGAAEAGTMATAGLALLALAVVILWWPVTVAVPLGVLGVWVALSLLVRAWRLHTAPGDRPDGASETPPPGPRSGS
jgi:cardiolipin synthase